MTPAVVFIREYKDYISIEISDANIMKFPDINVILVCLIMRQL